MAVGHWPTPLRGEQCIIDLRRKSQFIDQQLKRSSPNLFAITTTSSTQLPFKMSRRACLRLALRSFHFYLSNMNFVLQCKKSRLFSFVPFRFISRSIFSPHLQRQTASLSVNLLLAIGHINRTFLGGRTQN